MPMPRLPFIEDRKQRPSQGETRCSFRSKLPLSRRGEDDHDDGGGDRRHHRNHHKYSKRTKCRIHLLLSIVGMQCSTHEALRLAAIATTKAIMPLQAVSPGQQSYIATRHFTSLASLPGRRLTHRWYYSTSVYSVCIAMKKKSPTASQCRNQAIIPVIRC